MTCLMGSEAPALGLIDIQWATAIARQKLTTNVDTVSVVWTAYVIKFLLITGDIFSLVRFDKSAETTM